MLDALRSHVVSDLLSLKSVSRYWQEWGPQLRDRIGLAPTAESVLSVGDHLSGIFQSTATAGRSQAVVSGGGIAWEALVAWYINLATLGSPSITIKKSGQLPSSVREALSVKYNNKKTNTEADLVALTFTELKYGLSGSSLPHFSSFDAFSSFCDSRLGDLQVAVIQCKTNWNDNAQIPMLWDMVYSASGFPERNIIVGENNRSLKHAGSFRYAFVTVPTVNTDSFKRDSTAVMRVMGLSGGNYWGRPSRQGVAGSLKEIFTGARIGSSNIRESLNVALQKHGIPDYFGI